MKLVPYTVMVPEHYATFMRAMGEILPGFEEAWAMHFVDQVFQDHDDPSVEFGHSAALATANLTFDTEKEKEDAQRLIQQACRELLIADAVHLGQVT